MKVTHPEKTENRLGNQFRVYFQELQKNLLDSCDKRGQRHNLAFVLTSFLMAVLRTTGHWIYHVFIEEWLKNMT